ncbi:DNA polymerase LigD, polymerase domain protein [Thermaerobacter marianensis DSM 12885]|uniref:DNA polymerase LigD, polymerase domain protein n=1 Tax=Thermaerobacter marianensis (strain ATCC 700841 / DSM 12885 / JCM 10246 / 7p75a) TaxID=644966 RepID=E6SKN2_THEM7|nr:non-homologous end-joining DNA ligase [Thermaerobacter marianensis]ADU51240.1 DNA polymerase LigD, polymerase domain protein [Thermaerobacter marianensis DSM 12885]
MAEERLRVQVAGRELEVSHLDRVLWPGDGLTKADFIGYLLQVAPYLLPHLRDRPLVCTRYPDGAGAPGFYQKDAPAGTPPWVRTWPHRTREGRRIRFILADEPATLAWLGQQAAIEIHPWLSTIHHPHRPDWVVFDLDPGPRATFAMAVEVALLVRQVLAALELEGYPKTSGATGLHVFVPILPEHPYPVVTEFARRLAGVVERLRPALVTTVRAVAQRPPSSVYLDFLQNGLGKTLVTVYGPRPRPGAPVSMPVTWDELERGVDPGTFTLRTAPARLQQVGDLWALAEAGRRSLTPACRRLGLDVAAGRPLPSPV